MNSRLSILFSIATLFTKCNIIDSHEKQANQIKLTEIFSDSQTIDGHKKRIIFINTIDRGDYFYIPQAAFSDSIDAVLFQDKGLSRVHPNKRPVVFSWYSNCNDGNYNLTITPEQIFFSSGHDNPNPNYLYWIVDISKEQFEAINEGVRKSARLRTFMTSQLQEMIACFKMKASTVILIQAFKTLAQFQKTGMILLNIFSIFVVKQAIFYWAPSTF